MRVCANSGIFGEHSLQEAMRLVKYAGFDGMELVCRKPHISSGTTLTMVKELRNLALYELNLEVPVLSGVEATFASASDLECGRMFANFLRILEWAAILGADSVGLSLGGPAAHAAEDYHYGKAAYWLNMCAESAAK